TATHANTWAPIPRPPSQKLPYPLRVPPVQTQQGPSSGQCAGVGPFLSTLIQNRLAGETEALFSRETFTPAAMTAARFSGDISRKPTEILRRRPVVSEAVLGILYRHSPRAYFSMKPVFDHVFSTSALYRLRPQVRERVSSTDF